MDFKKALLSAFLLFTYSLGLAHEVIPHCHHNSVGQESHNSHVIAHHDLHQHHDAQRMRIEHRDHCDIGLFDLIVSLMSETEHPASCDERSLHLPSIAHDISEVHATKLFLTASICYVGIDFSLAESTTQTFCHSEARYGSPLLAHTSLRGPPVISC